MQSGSLAEIRLILIVLLCLLPRTETNAVARIKTQAQTEQPTQTERRVLEMGKPLERELAGGQSHIYQLSLAAGQYLHIVTEQRGIDVVIAWVGPDDKKLMEVDSPNGTQGPEPLTWITEAHGNYRLVIRSNDKAAKVGQYEVKLVELRAATEADQVLAEARRLDNESAGLRDKGKLTEAIALAERALTLREKTLDLNHPDVALSLNNLGELYFYSGDYANAESFYRRSLAIREQRLGPDHSDVAESLNNLAVLYEKKGNTAAAEPLYARSLVIWEKALGPNHPYVASALNNLGALYFYKGNYVEAELLYQRSLALREQVLGPNHAEVANALSNLAVLYNAKGDYEKAESFFQRALSIREKVLGPDHPEIALTFHNLANLYRNQNVYGKAELLLNRALTIYEKTRLFNHPDFARTLNELTMLYIKQGAFAKAEPLGQRALALVEQLLGPYHPEVADVLSVLAILNQARGDYARAEQFYQRALSIREKALGPSHLHVLRVLNNLAEFYRAKGEVQQAITFAARAAESSEVNLNQTLVTGSERQKLSFLALREQETNLIVSLHTQAAPADPIALKLALTTLLRRKGRGLDATSDALATLRRRASPQDPPLFEQLVSTRSQLAALTLRGPGRTPTDQFRTQIQQLADEADKLEANLSSRSAEFRAQAQPVTIAAIQAALPTNAALVEFATYHSYDTKPQKNGPLHYMAYSLTAQGEPRWVELGAAAPLERAVAAWRQALRDPKRTDVNRLAREVDAKVMQPVRALLGDARHLLISPDGVLNLIPFAALVDERQQYLTQRYECSYLTSGRDLLRLQVPRASQSAALIVANPAFGEMPQREMLASRKVALPQTGTPNASPAFDFSQAYFQPLPGTADEARTLHALLPQATVLTQAQATKLALQEVKAPRLLHIATHGFFLRDAEAAADSARGIRLPSESVGMAQTSGPLIDPSIRSGLALAGANRHQTSNSGSSNKMCSYRQLKLRVSTLGNCSVAVI